MYKYKVKIMKAIRHFQRQVSTKISSDELRFNEINVQMLSKNLHRQIFATKSRSIDEKMVKKSKDHLENHKLWGKKVDILPDVSLQLPKLQGNNIESHFSNIAEQQSKNYRKYLNNLAHKKVPSMPSEWNYAEGWTKYEADGTFNVVDFPDEDALVFDVEVCMQEGSYPTLATAVSSNSWYSWCSRRLIETGQGNWNKDITTNDLIPFEIAGNKIRQKRGDEWKERVVVGHNVSFDRSFIKEQYLIDGTKMKFIDTMSLHICVSGQTGAQRRFTTAYKAGKKRNDGDHKEPDNDQLKSMLNISSLNNLRDVHSLYCPNSANNVDKQQRNVFVEGSMEDIRSDFHNLMTYCANDVVATHEIIHAILPMFDERFPSPVTFAGMLEMSTAYLPINRNWFKYIDDCQTTYVDVEKELKSSLMKLADEACQLLHDEKYKEDVWLWNLDWNTKPLPIKKSTTKKTKGKVDTCEETVNHDIVEDEKEEINFEEKVKDILDTKSQLYKIRPILPGYPKWYTALCTKNDGSDSFVPGPHLISTQVRVVPKLIRLTYEGFPLHFDEDHGWGYLIPGFEVSDKDVPEKYSNFPFEKAEELFSFTASNVSPKKNLGKVGDGIWAKMKETSCDSKREHEMWKAMKEAKLLSKKIRKNPTYFTGPSMDKYSPSHQGNKPYDVGVPGCSFFRLPHKDGNHLKVGNPLSKDFLAKFEDGILETFDELHADQALKLSIILSYWKNNKNRILSQMVVRLNKEDLPTHTSRSENYDEDGLYGAIIPRIVCAGTVTRRAVETTWMTASNAYPNRLGSELKSLIQAPPGYHFIGADVDSQELWIASLLGDSEFANMHGCTALGWMTLQGKKKDETDMHSRTAAIIGVSRDQAKVLNYSRIYGAGKYHTKTLLLQFNHALSKKEAEQKAKKMLAETKGTYDFQKLMYSGGSESEMFNKLEEIASCEHPKTPVLSCQISRALEPQTIGKDYMTSRVNWVVQSSAVDFLHLMLVNMRWLLDYYKINARFSISIHDEVRYLIKSEDRYEGALALQMTNLFTRAMFSKSVGINDLPQAVAFFSSVDIDTVLRKEVDMDCVTPSNPHGLQKGYNIPRGESLDIHQILEKTKEKSSKAT